MEVIDVRLDTLESAMLALEAIARTDPTVAAHLKVYRSPERIREQLAFRLALMAIDLASEKTEVRRIAEEALKRLPPLMLTRA